MEWVLIFALYMDRGGGPATARFADKAACEQAIVRVKEVANSPMISNFNRYSNEFAICVPYRSRTNER